MVDILSPQEAAWRLLLFLTPRSFDAGQVHGYPLPKDSSGSHIRVVNFISHIYFNQNHPVPTS
ncbi:MAG TPA: hypothetical protein VFX82_10475 [Desulfobacterales bacterium]|nr:hypothetical protein [Desulfobacterales bacterium]